MAFAVITIGVLVTAVAGLLLYGHIKDKHAAKARAVADARAAKAAKQAAAAAQVDAVRQAYLAHWTALGQAELQGDASPLGSVDTPTGLAADQKTVQAILVTGYHYRLTTDQHDMHLVVYEDGTLASVDDVLTRHMTNLDAVSLTPMFPQVDLPVHASAAFRLQGGRWLFDSGLLFGADGSDPKYGVSYAVLARNNPIPPDVARRVEQGYLGFESGLKAALQNLDPTALQSVALEPALDDSLKFLNQLKAKNQGFAERLEHNYRIALKDP